jgi:hypothetical protein
MIKGQSSQETFRRQFESVFAPDDRQNALIDRLIKYYNDTPDSMNNRDAMVHWRSFKEWASVCGYTQDEINQAKRNCVNTGRV